MIDRQISLGEFASEQKPAFVVADLSTIWVDSVGLPPRPRSASGSATSVLIDPEDGGARRQGQRSPTSRRSAAADTQTRAGARGVANADGRLRPGLFVTGQPAARPKKPVASPCRPDCDPDAGEQAPSCSCGERRQVRGARRRARRARRRVRRDHGSACSPATSTRPRTASW